MATQTLYDRDFYLWTQQQSRELREAARSGVNLPIDWEQVAEEIEDMGKSVRFELRCRLATIIEHLLKLQHSPAVEPRAGWRSTIRRTRDDIDDVLKENPSLRREIDDMIADSQAKATRRVAHELWERGEIDRAAISLVESATFTKEQVLLDWFPEGPAGTHQ